MGKMEMSSTLKNLKFMQRAVPKEEIIKEEQPIPIPIPDGNFTPPSNVKRKCVVIMEGDPQPATTRGRMSFQNFNPLIDKLKGEAAANGHHAEASTSSLFQCGRSNERSDRKKKPLEDTDMDMGNEESNEEGNGELKRKQPKEFSQSSHPKKQQKHSQGNNQPSPSDNRNFHKQPKRDKLDFNVLRHKSQGKKKGR